MATVGLGDSWDMFQPWQIIIKIPRQNATFRKTFFDMIKFGFVERFSLFCFKIGEFPFYNFDCKSSLMTRFLNMKISI